MPFQQLLILAVVAMVGLAALRVVRVRLGQMPLPEAKGLFYLAFVVIPPIALAAVAGGSSGALAGVAAIPVYALLVLGLSIVMAILAGLAGRFAPGPWRSRALLALVGSEGDVDDVPFDPPVTPALQASVAVVEEANRAFPRGHAFPAEIKRPGFRSAWDALETANETLEGQIAAERKLGIAVASSAMATAKDARSRLDTLRRLAGESGQVWAS